MECCSICHTRTKNDLHYLEKLIFSECPGRHQLKFQLWDQQSSTANTCLKKCIAVEFGYLVSTGRKWGVHRSGKESRMEGEEQGAVTVLSHHVIELNTNGRWAPSVSRKVMSLQQPQKAPLPSVQGILASSCKIREWVSGAQWEL